MSCARARASRKTGREMGKQGWTTPHPPHLLPPLTSAHLPLNLRMTEISRTGPKYITKDEGLVHLNFYRSIRAPSLKIPGWFNWLILLPEWMHLLQTTSSFAEKSLEPVWQMHLPMIDNRPLIWGRNENFCRLLKNTFVWHLGYWKAVHQRSKTAWPACLLGNKECSAAWA